MKTTPYGDNEKEASLGGTASVCPQVLCVCCTHVCVCVCECERESMCTCVCQQESPRALWHLLIKTSQAAGQGRQMPVMEHTHMHTHTCTRWRTAVNRMHTGKIHKLDAQVSYFWRRTQFHPTHSGITAGN